MQPFRPIDAQQCVTAPAGAIERDSEIVPVHARRSPPHRSRARLLESHLGHGQQRLTRGRTGQASPQGAISEVTSCVILGGVGGDARRANATASKPSKSDASWVGRLRSLPIKPTNLKLADIKKAVRATLQERAAKTAK